MFCEECAGRLFLNYLQSTDFGSAQAFSIEGVADGFCSTFVVGVGGYSDAVFTEREYSR
jgi:hypothetical protein